MQTFDLPYGEDERTISLPERNVRGILELADLPPLDALEICLLERLERPTGTPSLQQMLRDHAPIGSLVILVSDITRGSEYPRALPTLLEYIRAAGVPRESVSFVIAEGTHRDMTPDEIRGHYGDFAVDNYPFENHDCRAADLVHLGDLAGVNPLLVNRRVAEADFIITTGMLNTHYFAGFSGGRKSILPGVSGYDTVRRNHAQIQHPGCQIANLEGNPIHAQMSEAATLAGVDFNLNFVNNQKKRIAEIFAGDIHDSFLAGTEYIRQRYSVKFDGPADVVITTPGGAPKDLTLYHTQKCMNNVQKLVKPGGTVVVLSQCGEGVGQQTMDEWLSGAANLQELVDTPPQRITIGGHRAVATAKLLQHSDIVLITNLSRDKTESLHFGWQPGWDETLEWLRRKHGDDFSAWVVPNGTLFYGEEGL
ncbi:MAG: nickel-dependent lactate racemase [Candidatus Cloacimonetes bacterium]|nr:nickel-dependent lactate racemase [Candidatus Cloacimonadota bacterium]